jgi:hypothetical protein
VAAFGTAPPLTIRDHIASPREVGDQGPLNNTIVSTGLSAGVWYELICAADQATKVLRLTINGLLVATLPFTTLGNGFFQSNRFIGFVSRVAGSLQFVR